MPHSRRLPARAVLIAAVLTVLGSLAVAPARAADFSAALAALSSKKFATRRQAADDLARSAVPRALPVLEAWLSGDLYLRKKDRSVVIARKSADGFELLDAATGKPGGAARKRELRKIRANNTLRKKLKGLIAGLRLMAPELPTRLAAATTLVQSGSGIDPDLLRAALAREREAAVKELLGLALATIELRSDDRAVRLQAIETVSGSLRQEVRALLQSITDNEDEEPALRAAAKEALESIELRLGLYEQVRNLFFGLSLGSVLLLAAVGLAITFGVMGVINMAHGEMVMLGAYTTYVVQTLMPGHLELSLFVALPAAFGLTAAVGILIERGVIRFLYGRPLETLLATFGLSLIIQQAVRTIFSPLNRAVSTPEWMSGAIEVNPALILTYNRIYIIVFALLVLGALIAVLRATPFGLRMRAVTQNRAMARAMGIRTARIDALTFGLGSGIAGLAGVALSQLTNVGPNMGQAYIVDSFMVVVFGGVGNLAGTFFGAMILGVVNKFLEPVTGAVLAKILVLVFIILFIQRRPRGLFALSGRSAEG